MKTSKEVAQEAIRNYHDIGPDKSMVQILTKALESYARERVDEAHKEIAAKQALVHGEGVMLGGRVVTNEELYKQPTDYIREARSEGFAEAREMAAKVAFNMLLPISKPKATSCADRIVALQPIAATEETK